MTSPSSPADAVPQAAVLAGSGRFPALALYSLIDADRLPEARHAVASLMKTIEVTRPGTLHTLVAVARRCLEGHRTVPGQALPPITLKGKDKEKGKPKSITLEGGDVYVQVSAETEEDRLYVLRLAEEKLKGLFTLKSELLGARLLNRREPFGYRDDLNPPTAATIGKVAAIAEGEARGASWLLHVRFEHELSSFFALGQDERNAVFGLTPNGEHLGGPADGHVPLMLDGRPDAATPTMIRRSFPYRLAAEEGLCFVAIAADPQVFVDTLGRMYGDRGGRDRMLAYVNAVEGGLYVVPPLAEWLSSDKLDLDVPPLAASFQREAPVALYEVVKPFLDYLALARTQGLYLGESGGMALAPKFEEIFAALNAALAGAEVKIEIDDDRMDPAVFAQLQDLLREIKEDANKVNRQMGEYITLVH